MQSARLEEHSFPSTPPLHKADRGGEWGGGLIARALVIVKVFVMSHTV